MDGNTSWFWNCACKALREAKAAETPSWRLRHNQGDITGVNQLTWLWELTTDTTQWHWHGYGVINQLGVHSWLSWFMLVYNSITMEKYNVPNLQIILQLWRHAVLLRFLAIWGPSFFGRLCDDHDWRVKMMQWWCTPTIEHCTPNIDCSRAMNKNNQNLFPAGSQT